MSRLDEKQLNESLRRAAAAIPSNHAEEIWNTPVEKADADAWFLQEPEKEPKAKTVHRPLRWAGLIAACFAVAFFGWFQSRMAADATVYLDVNPSLTMEVNRQGKVVSANAGNEDGRIVLDDMDLRGADVDVAMNAILGSMVKQGYLSQTENTLLISVIGKDEARTAALRHRLSADAGQALETLLGSGVVLGQTVDADDDAEDLAGHCGITPGKAALILRLMKDRPSWNIRELAAMPMADLIRCCQAAGIDIAQYLGEDGEILGDLRSLLDDDDDDCDDHDDGDDYDDCSDEDDDYDDHDDGDDYDDYNDDDDDDYDDDDDDDYDDDDREDGTDDDR